MRLLEFRGHNARERSQPPRNSLIFMRRAPGTRFRPVSRGSGRYAANIGAANAGPRLTRCNGSNCCCDLFPFLSETAFSRRGGALISSSPVPNSMWPRQEGFVRAMLDMVLYKPPLVLFVQLTYFASTAALSKFNCRSPCLSTTITLR